MNDYTESGLGEMFLRSERLKELLDVFWQMYIGCGSDTMTDKFSDACKMFLAISDLAEYYSEADAKAYRTMLLNIIADEKSDDRAKLSDTQTRVAPKER